MSIHITCPPQWRCTTRSVQRRRPASNSSPTSSWAAPGPGCELASLITYQLVPRRQGSHFVPTRPTGPSERRPLSPPSSRSSPCLFAVSPAPQPTSRNFRALLEWEPGGAQTRRDLGLVPYPRRWRREEPIKGDLPAPEHGAVRQGYRYLALPF